MRKIALVGLVATGCSAPVMSEDALTRAGFTDVEITGWEPFSCSDDDSFSTGFRAKNPNGIEVTGTVCCGLLAKDCTVRF